MAQEEVAKDMSGLESKLLGFHSHGIYLVMEGKARLIPNVPTFQNMFGESKQEDKEDAWFKLLEVGNPFPDDCCLIKSESDAIYLMDQTDDNKLVKRHLSPDAMIKYSFDKGRVFSLPNIVVNAIPKGQDITGK